MFGLGKKAASQWVCTICGYNIIENTPERCPFCGAAKDRIDSSELVSRRYRVTETKINDSVTQLKSAPKLGLEHAAYRIEGDGGTAWIDCPSVFNPDLAAPDAILFTHKDFIGAANQYQQLWDIDVFLHAADAELSEVANYSVNQKFAGDFQKFGIQAIHIGGHSPGFTAYAWRETLFICDYAYPPGRTMKLNPHGNRELTREGAGRLAAALSAQKQWSGALKTVCGYNYVVNFNDWQKAFVRLI